MYRQIIKPSLDYILIFLGLPVLALVFPLVCLISMVISREPLFFSQPRPGKGGRVFKLYKIRTLKHGNREISGFHIFLRNSGLDELPQLLNVFKRDMTLVGPRPLLVDYLENYTEFQNKRHQILPGITGWAQVNTSRIKSWNSLFDYDLEYLENLSFGLDMKILWKTFSQKLKALSFKRKEPSQNPFWLGSFTSQNSP